MLDYLWLLPLAAVPIVGIVACCCQVTCDFSVGSWTAASGSWTGTATSSANAVLTNDTLNPNGTAIMRLTATLGSMTTGDKARLYLDYDGSQVWAEIEKLSSGSTVRLGQGMTTLDECSDSSLGGSSLQVHLCITSDGTQFSFKRQLGLITNTVDIAPTTGNGQYALGTGDTVTGTVTFSDVSVASTATGCEECIVSICNDACLDEPPDQLQVIVSGVVDDDPSDCDPGACTGDPPNGTYICDKVARGCNAGCEWRLTFDETWWCNAFCTTQGLSAYLLGGGPTTMQVAAQFWCNTPTSVLLNANKTIAERTCSDLDETITTFTGSPVCDISGASARHGGAMRGCTDWRLVAEHTYRCPHCNQKDVQTTVLPIFRSCKMVYDSRARWQPLSWRHVVRLAYALSRHAKDLFRKRTRIEQARVLAICRACDRYDEHKDRCRECGCKMGGRAGWLRKVAWRSEHCPLEKW